MIEQINIDLKVAKEMQGFQKEEKDIQYFQGMIDALQKIIDYHNRVKK